MTSQTWWSSTDGKRFGTGPYDTKHEACTEASNHHGIGVGENFWVGREAKVALEWPSGADAIDHAKGNLTDRVGEAAEDWAWEIRSGIENELTVLIREAAEAWVKKHKLEPSCFAIVDVSEHTWTDLGAMEVTSG